MKHFLQKRILESTPRQEISPEEYDSIVSARSVLSAALSIEENWDFLLSNYLELEQQLLSLAAMSISRNYGEYKDIFDFRVSINLRIVNLLTSARMFVDQVPQAVSEIFEDDPEDETCSRVKELFRNRYDESFNYRFMEAFRNHVQHRGVPTHSIGFGSSWTAELDRQWNESYVFPFALRENLVDDQRFKKSVLDEMPHKVNLLEASRNYLELLGTIQKYIREAVLPRTNDARACIQLYMDRYTAVYQDSLVGLAAHRIQSDQRPEVTPLLLDWDDVRLHLQHRNSTLVNLGKRAVSSRTNF